MTRTDKINKRADGGIGSHPRSCLTNLDPAPMLVFGEEVETRSYHERWELSTLVQTWNEISEVGAARSLEINDKLVPEV